MRVVLKLVSLLFLPGGRLGVGAVRERGGSDDSFHLSGGELFQPALESMPASHASIGLGPMLLAAWDKGSRKRFYTLWADCCLSQTGQACFPVLKTNDFILLSNDH